MKGSQSRFNTSWISLTSKGIKMREMKAILMKKTTMLMISTTKKSSGKKNKQTMSSISLKVIRALSRNNQTERDY